MTRNGGPFRPRRTPRSNPAPEQPRAQDQWARDHIRDIQQNGFAAFRPLGNSMFPLIRSGQVVHVSECGPNTLRGGPSVGEIVLCTVNHRHYLHRVGAVFGAVGTDTWYRIENAAGHVNGWIQIGDIHGVLEP